MRFSKRYEVIIPKAELQFEIEKLCDFGDVEEYAYILHDKNVRNAHYHIYLCFTNPVALACRQRGKNSNYFGKSIGYCFPPRKQSKGISFGLAIPFWHWRNGYCLYCCLCCLFCT